LCVIVEAIGLSFSLDETHVFVPIDNKKKMFRDYQKKFKRRFSRQFTGKKWKLPYHDKF
jgi:hypothetical protein